ncbi:MAG: hypothetical protein EBT50_09140, partial [Verrucomicrobia bacterium]|nr:hypothetical protein [Verrucomicrobiota bacterium]
NRPLNGVMPRMIQYKNRSWHDRPKGIEVWQGGNYIDPIRNQPSPFGQGFALKVTFDGKEQIRTMDRKGWKNVIFTGAYPLGTVTYEDPDCPVKVTLEAFSPFCPLNYEDSSYPATIMSYRVENISTKRVTVQIGGWLENPVLIDTIGAYPGVLRTNSVVTNNRSVMLVSQAVDPAGGKAVRPDMVFEDFEKPNYEGWEVEGTAFGSRPVAKKDVPAHVGETGMKGERAVNSHASAPGDVSLPSNPAKDSATRDAAKGKLTSKPFTLDRNFITFLIGGGPHAETAVRLLVDGKVVQSASGPTSSVMREATFDVKAWAGKTAKLEILDQSDSGVWGHISVDQIVFRDIVTPLEKQRDWGSMALAAIGGNLGGGSAQLSAPPEQSIFSAAGPTSASSPAGKPL